MHATARFALVALVAPALLEGQSRQVSDALRPFVSVDAELVALLHVRIVDGTGQPAKDDQTIVMRGERIAAVGPAEEIAVPDGAHEIDLAGHTVIPGIIGLHDHMYYSSVAGSMKQMPYSYPRLFLANGVTTIRTTGSVDTYHELNLKRAIDAGEAIGPELHPTGPYLQGPGPGPGRMHVLDGPDDARRVVRYWAEEGVGWFKAYTQISRAELGAAIDEAHRHGIKVTAHLCSVTYREAVELGIDNLEHGLLASTDYWEDKQPDQCPMVASTVMYGDLDVYGPDVQATIRAMVDANVSMTSTLAVMELSAPSRVPVDQRVLDALFPAARESVARWYDQGRSRDDEASIRVLQRAMAFEREFVRAGGLLAAGSDPCCISAIAGFADQRNYELLVEAGFAPESAVQIMTFNGARVLGIADRVGSLVPGMQADLVVLNGDPTTDARHIRNVVTVFRRGLGFDSARLLESVRGQVGLR
jgi:imidazolonepropionase-like amidohydrolase